jgi:aspartate aminotransferase-like enzyme
LILEFEFVLSFSSILQTMKYLLTPGPVPVPDFVMAAINQPVIHHRTAAFEQFYQKLLTKLRYLFQAEASESVVGTMIGSGTYGVEAAMYSLFKPGETILVINNGKFSERWEVFGKLSGFKVVELVKNWGESPAVAEIVELLRENKTVAGVVLTHSETSTGALLDLEEISFAIKNEFPETLVVVDGITSIGTIPFYFDQWQIDAAITASQKALMNPTGTIAFALSALAQRKLRNPEIIADSRNLANYVKSVQKNSYPFTAPVQLLYGLDAALDSIKNDGLPTVWNRTHHSAKTFRAALARLGGKMIAENPSDSLTAFYFPERDNEPIRQRLITDYQIHLAGGQGEFKHKLMRVSHMGMADVAVMEVLVGKLKVILKK